MNPPGRTPGGVRDSYSRDHGAVLGGACMTDDAGRRTRASRSLELTTTAVEFHHHRSYAAVTISISPPSCMKSTMAAAACALPCLRPPESTAGNGFLYFMSFRSVQPPLVLYKSPKVVISYGAAAAAVVGFPIVAAVAGFISGVSKLRIRKSYVLCEQSELVLRLSGLLRIGIKEEFITLVLLPLELTVRA
ncbi:hypothetical protein PIB30_056968 [Stylosanthes scabra]|uniref:Uncharacterized protein n=1 Tax=Stylosanthes scabra TaxID=79078 RepID=A0ABU6YK53_9FABA|nr:hypothetical protein [Stylosanthes scabra]